MCVSITNLSNSTILNSTYLRRLKYYQLPCLEDFKSKCYYESRCQFATKGFSLSLDGILAYHIKPFVSFFKQSKEVKITAALTIVKCLFLVLLMDHCPY
jgi:hypothetical protein